MQIQMKSGEPVLYADRKTSYFCRSVYQGLKRYLCYVADKFVMFVRRVQQDLRACNREQK
jgi:hypothetical protein